MAITPGQPAAKPASVPGGPVVMKQGATTRTTNASGLHYNRAVYTRQAARNNLMAQDALAILNAKETAEAALATATTELTAVKAALATATQAVK